MGVISAYTAATTLTSDDVLVGNDGSTTKKFSVAVVALDVYQNHGNTSTTETVDLANGTVHRVVLDANCTFTFSGAVSGNGSSFTLIVTQDATGSRIATWPASVIWAGGVEPTLSTAASAVDILTFLTVDGGTTWAGFVAGQGMA
jgi:hypothetical protein